MAIHGVDAADIVDAYGRGKISREQAVQMMTELFKTDMERSGEKADRTEIGRMFDRLDRLLSD